MTFGLLRKPFRHDYLMCRYLCSNAKGVKWKSVVGLEVHAQISSKSKLFSGSQTSFGAPVNSSVSLFDAAVPGTLPVLNKECVKMGVKTALALSCKINEVSMFDRKHYFYADLPAGYQITQQRKPLAVDGSISFPVLKQGNPKKSYVKTVKLHQLQLEQDSGKSLHDEERGRSLVDLNRAGVPLMELVFDPDIETGEEAAALVKELVLILLRLGTCSCRMEEGALRVDANISLHKEGEPLGTRAEVKNIGSIRSVANAVAYEIERQTEILNSGGVIVNETRSWDANSKRTVAMRDKEVQQDYRFMPEPNLLPLHLNLRDEKSKSDSIVNVLKIKARLSELPNETRRKLVEEHNMTHETAIILVNEPTLLKYFMKITDKRESISTKLVCNFLINDLLTLCNKKNVEVGDCNIKVEKLCEIFDLLQQKEINIVTARLILEALYDNPEHNPTQIVEEKQLRQINDVDVIENLCKEAIANNEKAVKQYKAGKKKVVYALIGDVAKKTQNRANMEIVTSKMEELLSKF